MIYIEKIRVFRVKIITVAEHTFHRNIDGNVRGVFFIDLGRLFYRFKSGKNIVFFRDIRRAYDVRFHSEINKRGF